MAFRKEGDVEKHEVMTPDTNEKINELRRTAGKVDLGVVETLEDLERKKIAFEKDALDK